MFSWVHPRSIDLTLNPGWGSAWNTRSDPAPPLDLHSVSIASVRGLHHRCPNHANCQGVCYWSQLHLRLSLPLTRRRMNKRLDQTRLRSLTHDSVVRSSAASSSAHLGRTPPATERGHGPRGIYRDSIHHLTIDTSHSQIAATRWTRRPTYLESQQICFACRSLSILWASFHRHSLRPVQRAEVSTGLFRRFEWTFSLLSTFTSGHNELLHPVTYARSTR